MGASLPSFAFWRVLLEARRAGSMVAEPGRARDMCCNTPEPEKGDRNLAPATMGYKNCHADDKMTGKLKQ